MTKVGDRIRILHFFGDDSMIGKEGIITTEYTDEPGRFSFTMDDGRLQFINSGRGFDDEWEILPTTIDNWQEELK